jgi:TctA family transporter
MIGSAGDLRVFWSNWLVGSITTLALILLFWPVIAQAYLRVSRVGDRRSRG